MGVKPQPSKMKVYPLILLVSAIVAVPLTDLDDRRANSAVNDLDADETKLDDRRARRANSAVNDLVADETELDDKWNRARLRFNGNELDDKWTPRARFNGNELDARMAIPK